MQKFLHHEGKKTGIDPRGLIKTIEAYRTVDPSACFGMQRISYESIHGMVAGLKHEKGHCGGIFTIRDAKSHLDTYGVDLRWCSAEG